MSDLLSRLNRDGEGFLFRHGWVVELIIGLLKQDPDERLSITAAREIMAGALAAGKGPVGAVKRAKGQKGEREKGSSALEKQKFTPPPSGAPASIKALNAEQMEALKEAFAKFDIDGSGDIDAEEIVGAMSNMGVKVTLAEATKMIQEVDQDGNGKLDFTEFILMSQDLLLPKSELDSSAAATVSVNRKTKAEPLSASSVFGRRLTSTEGEPFRSLESMISIADKGLSEVLIQERSVTDSSSSSSSSSASGSVDTPIIGALKNYGEIVGFRNRADGDRWDVFVPGLPTQLPPGSRHRLTNVLGVILIKGGNHKLVVALDGNRPDAAAVRKDIDEFVDTYAASHANVRSKARIRYLELDDPFDRPAGSLDVKDLQLDEATPEDGESWLTSSF